MTQRRRRLLIGLAVLALLGVLALPAVHWRLIGWAKREPFYRGRPVSYYALNIRTNYYINPVSGYPSPRPLSAMLRRLLKNAPGPLAELVRPKMVWPETRGESVPLLVALLDQPDQTVRVWALCELNIEVVVGGHAAESGMGGVVPALTRLLTDPDPQVQNWSELMLWQIGPPDARPASVGLRRLLGDPATKPNGLPVQPPTQPSVKSTPPP
jgi:hypothetical protein